MPHIPVLVDEVLQHLNIIKGDKFIDGTFGSGGHTQAILKANPKSKVLAFDLDQKNLDSLRHLKKKYKTRIKLVHGNYRQMKNAATENGFEKVSGILLDLGFSSAQLDDPERGLSFQQSGPLDMRFDQTQELTAQEIINTYPEQKLKQIFQDYGEENFAKRIANQIVVRRKSVPISDTEQVFGLIKNSLPGKIRHKVNDVARRIFQALRIEVNQELENLKNVLPQTVDLLKPGGRVVVISFHSLEDRIVKNFFNNQADPCVCPPDFPECRCRLKPTMKVITRKPIQASEQEISINPRSKAAKLRAAERL